MGKLAKKAKKAIAKASIKVTEGNVNSVCFWILGQPKPPKGSERLKK
jgi:cyclic lactone autoinducer peptide